ncbi:HDIG domain-containing protein [Limnospira fusiformis KN01]|uniref:HD family phosphohydrolase n=1 Tax=Limnospira fusiformis TaxID=54297 RepID=UPI0016588E99|nr:HDIG domain-containing metalloprotein [Limnospira fusiformis]ULB46841.1 HDIG domain-containing protein [Limnospira fusiformis KN01]
MDRFESITRQIERLRSHTRHLSSRGGTAEVVNQGTNKQKSSAIALNNSETPAGNGNGSPTRKRRSSQIGYPLLWVIAISTLTGVMGVRFYNQPRLSVGRYAPEAFIAPADATIEDIKTTEEKRRAAQMGEISVLVIDPTIDREILQNLESVFDQINTIRELAGPLPYVNTGIVSTDVQSHIRQLPQRQWQELITKVNQTPSLETTDEPETVTVDKSNIQKFKSKLEHERQQRKAYLQLSQYRNRVDEAVFSDLISEISNARRRYAQAVDLLSEQQTSEARELFDSTVLNWSDQLWQETQFSILQIARQMLSQGIALGLPNDIIRQAASLHINGVIPPESQGFANTVLTRYLRPNLIKDPVATRRRAELAAQKVETVMVNVNQGDVIIQEGETITQREFVILDYFGKSERGINWRGLMGFVCLVTVSIVIVLVVQRKFRPGLRRRDYILLLILSLSTPVLLLLKIPATNLPAVGLLIGSFYGSAVGVTVVTLLSIMLPIGMEIETISLVASAAGGLVGSLMAGKLRSREELALLGGAVGITQGLVYLIATLIVSSTATVIFHVLLGAVTLKVLEGLAWSIVALGLSPYLEHVFDLITPIRLAELANPNRPLLKRLATEAPGTFQHTMFVASLAEAAASDLGCNVELVRTGTLYHDIGKMHDPLGFIENQMGGPNKHDEIDDPTESARIIKKHVSEGLVMARKCRLPKAIQAFIPEHQGQMLIAYFYYAAQQKAKEDNSIVVKEEDFRYDGPIPQSKETGIVMLADSCEAALRSLKDATHEEALQMVNKILRARWQDNQLVDSGLTREDMAKIAEIFVRVWEQVNHKRIAYPKGVFSSR